MQRVLVIYDATGKIWNIEYGSETAPSGIPSMFVDVPEGATLERLDMSNPSKPEPVYTYSGDGVNLQEEYKALRTMVDDMALALADVLGGAI